MVVYFDKRNILSFIRSARDRKFEDCMRMIQQFCEIKMTFPRSSVDSMNEIDRTDFMQWLNTLADGYSREFSWDCHFPPVPFERNSLTKKKHYSSVYCLEQQTKLKECLLIANEGEELSKLSTLFIKSNQYTSNVFRHILKWGDLNKYSSPCTDIIIVDKFLFSRPNLYNSNIYELIRTLCERAENNQINIVIFTLKEVYDKISKTTFVPDWNVIYNKIRKCVGKRTPRPNVTFVTAGNNKLDEHDRTIFTNYKTFASGDSFNYFDEQGNRITNGRWFHAHSLVNDEAELDAIDFIDDMQSIITDLKNLNSDLIMKDKVSNFLFF